MSASFATGRQMTEALIEARENLKLIYEDSAPIVAEVDLMVNRLTKGLEGERQVLFDFADRSACEDIAGFVDVYFTCLTTGGDRIKAVRRASDLIMDKIDIRNEIQALTAQKKFEAKILAALPPLIIGFLMLSSPDYLDSLYHTMVGHGIMTLSLAVMGVAFYWSTRITDIEV
jgi:tight adherence protein B